jgi:Protein of unknown function (DUF1570)
MSDATNRESKRNAVRGQEAMRLTSRMRAIRNTVAWCLLGTLAIDPLARADLIYFRHGGDAQIPATIAGNRVLVSMPDGQVELSRDSLRKLVPGFWPEAEWPARRRQAMTRDFDARFAAAWWALENGLTKEAAAEIRELHGLDPKHAPSARMTSSLDQLNQACPDPDSGAFQKALGIEASVARGPHVILFHQHSEAEASERIELLEKVITGFYLLFAAEGIDLRPPQARLVSAWFADKKDFLAFLHAEKADAFATTRGYFHPTWGAVVAFDARSTDEQRSARSKLAARREELHRFGQQLDGAPARARIRIELGGEPVRTVSRSEARSAIARIEYDITCETMLLDLDRRSVDLGTAAHEMIHQLAAESALLPRHDAFPVWLHEGLAAQFEVIRGGRWSGISRAHDLRLPDWRKIQDPLALERLVRDSGFGRGYQRDLYAQAWALVYYLRTRHAREFLTFLDLLRGPDSGEEESPTTARGDRVSRAFQRAFGNDLGALERDWRAFMATVKTPLEQNQPPDEKTPKGAGSTFRRKS